MITIYSKNNCPFCVQAKNLLKLKNIEFEEKNIELDPDAKDFILSQGHRTLPQIYQGQQLFVEGGFEGLRKMKQEEFDFKLGKVNLGTI